MKLTLAVLLAVTTALVAVSLVKAEEETTKDVPVFVQSLKRLQREPPVHTRSSTSRATIVTDWIDQKLDHFDQSETRTWKMRYMENDEHFVPGGPIFIYIGGEWSISPSMINGGHLWDMAKEHQGMLYYTEHRYYGESKPTADITTENLQYLHVKQALADLAHFIRTKRATVPGLANSKVILSGGSYSATMVVWFKRLYPELVAGGWASSAPILAKVDFSEYMEVVGRAMRELGSQQCYDRIKNGVSELESMFDNKRGAEVKAMMKICNNFNENNDLDKYSLFGTIGNIFAGFVQYQYEGEVPYICDLLMSFEDDLTAITGFFVLYFGGYQCLDVSYKSTLSYYIDTTYIYGASRPWYYQTCNEYGWYQSSGSANQPFGSKFPALLYTTLCSDVFGAKYSNERINALAAQTNVDFGGMTPNVENIYMTHGALDPWNPMGHGEAEGATVIPRASHCTDFGSISPLDSSEMSASKERLSALVRQWLADDDEAANIADSGNDSNIDKTRRFMKQLVH